MENEIADNKFIAFWVNHAKQGKDIFDKLTTNKIEYIEDFIKNEIDNSLYNNWDYLIESFDGLDIDFTEYDEDYEEGNDTINMSGEDFVNLKYKGNMIDAFDNYFSILISDNWKESIRDLNHTDYDDNDWIIEWLDNWNEARRCLDIYVDNTDTEEMLIKFGYIEDEPMLK